MLADVDASLAAWLSAELPAGTRIDFASPAGLLDHRRSGRSARTVNLFLHDIAEEQHATAATDVYVRDPSGRVFASQEPLRRYRLSYLVTAWATDAEEEHQMLGAVLTAHGGKDALHVGWLRGYLHELNVALPLRFGVNRVSTGDPGLWASLGVPARTSVELSVSVPVPPVLDVDIPTPVHTVQVGVEDLTPDGRSDVLGGTP